MQFLKYVADDIRKRFHNDLSRIAIVFPNKRSGIFFDDYLLNPEETTPVWAPTYTTLDDLFNQLSPLKKVDDIKAVCKLYKIYQPYADEIHQKEGREVDLSLDFFFGWGEQLISDFSDIDRSMADVEKLFDSWSSDKILEELSEEECKYLKPLIKTFNSKGRIREAFSFLWEKLYNIYKQLNNALAEDGEAYNGARERQVIEGLRSGSIKLSDDIDTYIFVGFNMLVPTEWAMLDYMKQADRALFYWDYDQMYTQSGTLFTFGKNLINNIKHFSNCLGEELFDNLSHCEGIEFVAAPTDYGQTQFMNEWLSQNLTEKERDTAVVLCDETQLQPVIHNLPDNIKEINVTKGFPLRHTPVYTEVTSFFERIDKENSEQNDQLLLKLSKQLQQHAQTEIQKYENESWLKQLTAESYFQCFTMVNRVEQLVKEGLLDVSLRTLSSLLKQLMGNLSIPFHGEPASGLQVLGVLETRNLDFQNILMLSVNDGIIPRKAADHSFIPYDLRKYFHIITNDDRSEVYAYNFFRALQRCKKITLVFNESTDGEKHRGEMSRFMLQILTQTNIPVSFYSLKEQNDYTLWSDNGLNEDSVKKLMENRVLNLSPSGLNTYLKCPQKFFLSKVLKLNEIKKPTDILAANTFGSIFHKAAELMYQPFLNRKQAIKEEELNELANNDFKLRQLLEKAFEEVSKEDASLSTTIVTNNTHDLLYKIEDHELEASVLTIQIKNLLRYDAHQAKNYQLKIIATEKKAQYQLDNLTKLNGIVDRVDETCYNSIITKRIVDYKTGKYYDNKMKTKDLTTLFYRNDSDYIIQTLFYNLLTQKDYGECAIPALYFIRKLNKTEFVPYLTIGNDDETLSEKVKQFKELLEKQVERIRTREFRLTDDTSNCQNCPFIIICGRQ